MIKPPVLYSLFVDNANLEYGMIYFMTRGARRIIFYLATILFFVAGYGVLLYAQGYKYNFSENRFTRTGAISLRVNTPAHVLVNGVDKASTSFITNSASVPGLIPGTYTISVQKEGHSTWNKKIVVQEGFVQDFPHVLLLPQSGDDRVAAQKEISILLYPPTPSPTPQPSASPTKSPRPTPKPSPSISPTPDPNAPYFIDKNVLYVQEDGIASIIASNVSKVYQSEDGKKLVWASGNQAWLYWLADDNGQPFHKAGEMQSVAKLNYPIKSLSWFRDSDHIVVDAGGYKVLEIDTRGGQNIINI